LRGEQKPLTSVFQTLAWGVALEAGILFAGMYLARNATGAAAVQAVMAEFGAGRLTVTWSDPARPMPTTPAIVRRALIGAGWAAAFVVLLVGVAVATKAATVQGVNSVGLAQLAIGVVLAALLAVKDELVLRGIVLRAFDGAVSTPWQLAICGLVAAAAAWGMSQGAPLESVSAGALGVALATLWKVDGGAWMAWGARATFHFLTATVTQGAVLDVRAAPGTWGGGDSGLLAGGAGATVAVGVGIFAVAAYFRKNRRSSSSDNQ